jgi:hypothetical protein
LEQGADLAPGSWQPAGTGISDAAGVFEFVQEAPAGKAANFYRVRE